MTEAWLKREKQQRETWIDVTRTLIVREDPFQMFRSPCFVKMLLFYLDCIAQLVRDVANLLKWVSRVPDQKIYKWVLQMYQKHTSLHKYFMGG